MLRRGYRVVYRIRRHMRYTLIPHITLTLELNVKLLLLKILLLLTLTVFNSITLLFLNVTQLYSHPGVISPKSGARGESARFGDVPTRKFCVYLNMPTFQNLQQ